MPFETKQQDGHHLVLVDESRLDATMADSFKNYLFEEIDGGAKMMIIDLSAVRFMDSSGLGALVAALKKLSDKGSLKLVNPQPAVIDLFDLTSMDKLFKIFPSMEDAVQGG